MSIGSRRRSLRAYSVRIARSPSCTQLKADFSQMSIRARIARSPSSTSSVSRRVTPTEPDTSRFRGTKRRKVDPAGHAALSKFCFHCGACFHFPVSLQYFNRQKSDSQNRGQRHACLTTAHSGIATQTTPRARRGQLSDTSHPRSARYRARQGRPCG